eukprot:1151611-Pelagomonas_calceolata.AAC.3
MADKSGLRFRAVKLADLEGNSCITMMSKLSLNLVRWICPAVEQHTFDWICWFLATHGAAGREWAGPPPALKACIQVLGSSVDLLGGLRGTFQWALRDLCRQALLETHTAAAGPDGSRSSLLRWAQHLAPHCIKRVTSLAALFGLVLAEVELDAWSQGGESEGCHGFFGASNARKRAFAALQHTSTSTPGTQTPQQVAYKMIEKV